MECWDLTILLEDGYKGLFQRGRGDWTINDSAGDRPTPMALLWIFTKIFGTSLEMGCSKLLPILWKEDLRRASLCLTKGIAELREFKPIYLVWSSYKGFQNHSLKE